MQIGNEGGMFMDGASLMGQAAMGKFQAMSQSVANIFGSAGQNLAQATQQRNNPSGRPMNVANGLGPNAQMLSSTDPRMALANTLEVGPGSVGPNVPGGPPPTGPGGGYVGPSATPPGGGNSGGGYAGPSATPPVGGNSGGGGGNKGGGGGSGKTPVGGTGGGMDFSRGSMMGGVTNVAGMVAPVMMGVGNIQQGKTVEGIGNIGGGAAALAATRGMNPGVRLGAAVLGSMGVGGLGAAADRQIASTTGQGSEEYNQEKQRYQTQNNLNTFIQGMNSIQKNQLENDLLRMKAMEPQLNRLQDKMLVRQQAMNASLTNSYAMLGTLASAGKMAQQGQREAGATFRTALTANPYAGSVVAAPNISF